MPNYSKRASLALSKAERGRLERLNRSQICPVHARSNRARILPHYAEGRSIVAIRNLTGRSSSSQSAPQDSCWTSQALALPRTSQTQPSKAAPPRCFPPVARTSEKTQITHRKTLPFFRGVQLPPHAANPWSELAALLRSYTQCLQIKSIAGVPSGYRVDGYLGG